MSSAVASEELVQRELAAVADAGDPLLLVDLDGTVLGASRPIVDALGATRDEIVGRQLYDSLPSGDTSDLPVLVTGLLTNGRERVDTHATAVGPDGEPADLTLTFELVVGADGTPVLLRVRVADS